MPLEEPLDCVSCSGHLNRRALPVEILPVGPEPVCCPDPGPVWPQLTPGSQKLWGELVPGRSTFEEPTAHFPQHEQGHGREMIPVDACKDSGQRALTVSCGNTRARGVSDSLRPHSPVPHHFSRSTGSSLSKAATQLPCHLPLVPSPVHALFPLTKPQPLSPGMCTQSATAGLHNRVEKNPTPQKTEIPWVFQRQVGSGSGQGLPSTSIKKATAGKILFSIRVCFTPPLFMAFSTHETS